MNAVTPTPPATGKGGGFALPLGLLAGVTAVDFAALLPGWWWMTAVTAFLSGAAVRGAWRFWAMVVGALLAWTAMLLWQGGAHLAGIAGLVGTMVTGAAGSGWLAFAATGATVSLLSLAGGWCGGALRRLVSALRGAAGDAGRAEERPVAAPTREPDAVVPGGQEETSALGGLHD